MFEDEHACCYQVRISNQLESPGIVVRVGWIEIDHVIRVVSLLDLSLQKFDCVGRNNGRLILRNLTESKIGTNERAHPARTVNKRDMLSPARQRLDANCARARTKIEQPSAFNSRREDVEKSFAQTVRRRTGLK